jgi:hypothetical protein
VNVRSLVAVLGLTTVGALALPGQALASLGVGPTPVTSFSYTSAPGEFISAGTTSGTFSPSTGSSFATFGNAGDVTLSVGTAGDDWQIHLVAPRDQVLVPGTYHDAEQAPFQTGRAPGLDVSSPGRRCSNVYGSFAIDQIESDATGNVARLQGSFTQHCDSPSAPALRGRFDYRAVPLLARFRSEPGDIVGFGSSSRFSGAVATFDVRGSRSDLEIVVSGQRQIWDVELAAPSGRLLTARTYRQVELAPFQSGANAGLNVSHAVMCDTVSGSFTIKGIRTDASGALTFLSASFVQRCNGSTAALRGTIVWHA